MWLRPFLCVKDILLIEVVDVDGFDGLWVWGPAAGGVASELEGVDGVGEEVGSGALESEVGGRRWDLQDAGAWGV